MPEYYYDILFTLHPLFSTRRVVPVGGWGVNWAGGEGAIGIGTHIYENSFECQSYSTIALWQFLTVWSKMHI